MFSKIQQEHSVRTNWLCGIYNKNYYVCYYLPTVCYTSFRSVQFIKNVFVCVCTLFFLGNLLINIYQHTIFEQLQSYLMLHVMPLFYVLHNMVMNFTWREGAVQFWAALFWEGLGRDECGCVLGLVSGCSRMPLSGTLRVYLPLLKYLLWGPVSRT